MCRSLKIAEMSCPPILPRTWISLPVGSTTVDFAYAVHTEIGPGPALVVATPGAESRAPDGYGAALLVECALLSVALVQFLSGSLSGEYLAVCACGLQNGLAVAPEVAALMHRCMLYAVKWTGQSQPSGWALLKRAVPTEPSRSTRCCALFPSAFEHADSASHGVLASMRLPVRPRS